MKSWQELRRVAPMAENGELRSFLARFLFTGEDVFKSVKDLSGGEKGRLALAKLIYSNKNVLILDEPTNHLDIPSREALENALDEYQGTIITVSHDRFFLDKISTQILSFEEAGRTEIFDGNYSEYHDWKVKEKSKIQSPKSKVEEQSPAFESVIEEKQTEVSSSKNNLSKNQLQRFENRIKEIEKQLPELESELAKISLTMTAPETAADHAKLAQISAKFTAKEKQIQQLYEEWETCSEELK